MVKFWAVFTLSFLALQAMATVTLTATVSDGRSVLVRWNMVNYPGNTAYTLFKSDDGVIWVVAAANAVFRNYNAATLLAYSDNFSGEEKLYYRVKIYDTNENLVEISNTAVVDNPKNTPAAPFYKANLNRSEEPFAGNNKMWQIVPNPVADMLNLIYTGKNMIKGVINITIQDGAGKAVVRFRAASKNKQLHITVSNLHTGIYFIKINVFNEVQLNEKFIKR